MMQQLYYKCLPVCPPGEEDEDGYDISRLRRPDEMDTFKPYHALLNGKRGEWRPLYSPRPASSMVDCCVTHGSLSLLTVCYLIEAHPPAPLNNLNKKCKALGGFYYGIYRCVLRDVL